jgi:hypothetical protein
VSSQTFDPSTIKRSYWIGGIGAVVAIISTFFEWYTVSANVAGVFSVSRGWSGNDATWVALIVWICALVVLAVIAIDLFATNVTLPAPGSLVILAAGVISSICVLFRLIFTPGYGAPVSVSVSVSYGIFIALIACLAMAYAGYLEMQAT